MLLPAAECPSCRKRPRIRVADCFRERMLAVEADAVVVTYQCHRCHTIYPLKASAFQRAT